jgi:ubiquinone/menaquinone biosynthesis C-methylase UbiE
VKPEFAQASSDAIARTRHPRLDYRTEEAQRYTARLRPLFQKLVFRGCRALDLGCGAGKFTFELERLGAQATGLDCSQEAIHLAHEFATATGSSAEFCVGLFEDIPFPNNSFDLVIFPQNIIECSYEEMDVIARQVSRIMSPTGKFCLEMQDGLERFCSSEGREESFDIITGNRQSIISVPNAGEFPYEVTFWTIGFARFVVSRYLNFVKMEREDNRRYVLLFEKPTSNIANKR